MKKTIFGIIAIGAGAAALGIGADNAGAGILFFSLVVLLAMLPVSISGKLSMRRRWFDATAGSVTITEATGQLGGTVTTEDRTCGLVLTGTPDDTYVLGTPILITSLEDLATNNITETNNPFAYRQVTEFYSMAPIGSKLYLMLVADSLMIDDMANVATAGGAKKLLDYAEGKIKVLGIMTDDKYIVAEGGTVTITNQLNADVYVAATNGKAMETQYRAAQKPFRMIIGGTSYGGTPASVTDMSAGSNNRCAILIGDTQVHDSTNCAAALGLLLGKVAANPVHVKISRVKDGALPISAVYLKASTYENSGTAAATLAGRNYITFTKYPNKAGYYFSGDPMLAASTDDYWFLARGRVIDKARVIAYTIFAEEIDDNIPTIAGGKPDPGFVKWLEQQIINQITLTMVANGEISEIQCFIDLDQNVISTNTLNVVLKIRPEAYLNLINITLGFTL